MKEGMFKRAATRQLISANDRMATAGMAFAEESEPDRSDKALLTITINAHGLGEETEPVKEQGATEGPSRTKMGPPLVPAPESPPEATGQTPFGSGPKHPAKGRNSGGRNATFGS